MSTPVTSYVKFQQATYEPRYQFDRESVTIHDTKYRREIEAKAKRGGPSYYRLVRPDGVADHVLASEIFGEDAPILNYKSEFDPVDFNDRYDFDWAAHSVSTVSGKPMTLANRNGWKHYFLRNNDGRRVAVTPAEIRDYAAGRELWEVPLPPRARTAKGPFPNLAFTPDGKVWIVRSTTPIIRPVPVAIDTPGDSDETTFYRLTGASGTPYKIARSEIKKIFKSPKHIQ